MCQCNKNEWLFILLAIRQLAHNLLLLNLSISICDRFASIIYNFNLLQWARTQCARLFCAVYFSSLLHYQFQIGRGDFFFSYVLCSWLCRLSLFVWKCSICSNSKFSTSWRKCNPILISNCSLNVRLQYKQCNVIHSTFQNRLHQTVIEYDARTLKYSLSLPRPPSLSLHVLCITSKSTNANLNVYACSCEGHIEHCFHPTSPPHSFIRSFICVSDSSSISLHASFDYASLDDNIQMLINYPQ